MTTNEYISFSVKKLLYSDPIAELAAEIIKEGITEEELRKNIGNFHNHPLGLELHNKYRDIKNNGWTINRYGKKLIWKIKL